MALTAAFAQAQDFNKQISVNISAMRLGPALEKLSHDAGVNLRAGAALSNEVVEIISKDLSVLTIMNKLAQVTGGEWAKESDGYRLVVAPSITTADNKLLIAERTASFKNAIDDMMKPVNETPNLSVEEAKKQIQEQREAMQQMMQQARDGGNQRGAAGRNMRGLMNNNPEGRAAAKFLALIGAENLAAIPTGNRIVYATSPTQMQKGLGNNAWSVVQQYMAERQNYRDAMAQMPQEGNLPGIRTGGPGGPGGQTTQQDLAPAKLIIVCQNQNNFFSNGMVNVQFMIANKSGQIIGSGFSFVNADQAEPTVSNSGEGDAITVSESAKTWAKILKPGGVFGGGPMMMQSRGPGGRTQQVTIAVAGSELQGGGETKETALTEEQKKTLLDVANVDPLSLVASEVFASAANNLNTNMIACLPDELVYEVSSVVGSSGITVSQLLETSKKLWKMKVTQENGLLLIQPEYPFTERASRVDRVGLSKILAKTNTKAKLSLEELGAYALARTDSVSQSAWDGLYWRLINPASAREDFMKVAGFEKDGLRIYASVDVSTRQQMAKGQPVRLSSLSPNARALVDRLIWHSQDGPSNERPNANGQNGNNQGPAGPGNRGQGGQGRGNRGGRNGGGGNVPPPAGAQQEVSMTIVADVAFEPQRRGGGEFSIELPPMMDFGGGQVFMGGGPGQRGGMMIQGFGPGGRSILDERTEFLPNGTPGDAVLTMKISNDPAIIGYDTKAGTWQSMDPGQLAFTMAMKDDPNIGRFADRFGTIDAYQPATETSIVFTVKLKSTSELSRSVRDVNPLPNTKPGTFDQLPADIRNQIQQEAARTKERMSQRGQRDGGGQRARPGGPGGGANPNP